MALLKQLRTKADQVTLEADKALRVNRKQAEIGQIRKQIEQQMGQLGAIAYGLHKQGEGLASGLQLVCQQIDGLYVMIQQAELEIEHIRQEGLPVEVPVAGIRCSVCSAMLPDTAAFCPNCGSPRSKPASPITCATCGNVMPADARFCANCGQPVEAPAPPSSTASLTASPLATASTSVAAPFEASSESLTADAPAAAKAGEESAWSSPEEPSMPAAVFCSNCQAELPTEAAFCPICGTPTR